LKDYLGDTLANPKGDDYGKLYDLQL